MGLAHLVVYFPFVVDSMATELSYSAFSEGIVQNEKVQFLKLLQLFFWFSKVLVHAINLFQERHGRFT